MQNTFNVIETMLQHSFNNTDKANSMGCMRLMLGMLENAGKNQLNNNQLNQILHISFNELNSTKPTHFKSY